MKRETYRHRLAFIGAFALCFATSADVAFAAKPSGKSLIPSDVTALTFFGTPNPADAVQLVPAVGQDFRLSLVINTIGLNIPHDSDSGLTASLNTPITKGDVLWISFMARCLESRRETGEAAFELRFDQLVNGNYKWPSYLASGVSFGREWTEVSIPFLVPRNVESGGMGLIMSFDAYPQKFEIGPVTFINCGPKVKVAVVGATWHHRSWSCHGLAFLEEAAFFCNPNTVGFVQWGFWERQHWFPSAAMWNKDWSIRKHGQVFVDMVMKEWRTDANGWTSTDGTFETSAFYGDYDLTVSHGGRNKVIRIKHLPGTAPQNIRLD